MTPCTCHPGKTCASAASCAAARRVEFGENEMPEFVTAIDYADNQNDTTTNMIDVRVPIGTRLALQAQPAAPLRLDQIDLEPLKAELSDPAKAKAFLQRGGFLNASGELAERYGGKPEQPAAAGVSDAEIDRAAQIIANDQGCGWPHIPESWKEGFRETASAILALRPQAVTMTEGERLAIAERYCTRNWTDNYLALIDAVIADVQAHHGITAQGAPEVARGAHIKATMFHDAGAYAECGACGRYSDDPKTLSDRQPVCDCGKQHYWSGSFKPPGFDAKWSDHNKRTAQGAQGGEAK